MLYPITSLAVNSVPVYVSVEWKGTPSLSLKDQVRPSGR